MPDANASFPADAETPHQLSSAATAAARVCLCVRRIPKSLFGRKLHVCVKTLLHHIYLHTLLYF